MSGRKGTGAGPAPHERERRVGRLYRAAERRLRATGPLAGLLLVLCVLAMHGFQAASGPNDMTGVPLAAASAGHHAAPAPASAFEAGHSGRGDLPGDHHQDHPGGQVCLAMLGMVSFLVAVVALLLREPAAVVRRASARVRVLVAGRPPPRPSLHRLSVLRL